LRAVLANALIDWVDGWALSFYRAIGALCVGTGLVTDRLQLAYAVLQHQVGQIGHPVFDGVIESLELGSGLGRPQQPSPDQRQPVKPESRRSRARESARLDGVERVRLTR
jgi:hypothetical protein